MTFLNSTTSIPSPVFDYTSRDYESIFQDLLDRKQLYLPGWTSQNQSDFGVVLLQMFAYVGDLVGYYLDRLAGESFLATATQPTSILNIAAMLDYTPALSSGATTDLQITVSSNANGPFVIPIGTQFSTQASLGSPAVIFETTAALTIAGANGSPAATTGTVAATQGQTYTNELVGTADGTLNQSYALDESPVSADPSTGQPDATVSVDLGLGSQAWTYLSNLASAGPTDQVWTSFVDSNGTFWILFGDGVNGYVPPLGSPIYATYTVNVGSLGNVGAATITQTVGAVQGTVAGSPGTVPVTGVTNAAAATGGADAESLASVQENAPRSLQALNRGVTSSDVAALAEAMSGVLYASESSETYQLVNLYIAPTGGGAPSSALLASVQSNIQAQMLVNTTVTALAPTYVPVDLTISVTAQPNYGNTSVQTAIETLIQDIFNIVNVGFAFRISLGYLYQIIYSVPGVTYANITLCQREFITALTSQLNSGTSYLSLAVTALPQAISSGDALQISYSGGSLSATASAAAAIGAVAVYIDSVTPSANIAVGSTVKDTTAVLEDAVMAANEIPTLGTLTVNVTGGITGS